MHDESNPAIGSNFANEARLYARIAAGNLYKATEIKSYGAFWRVRGTPENLDLLNELTNAERNFGKAVNIYAMAGMCFGISTHFANRIARQINGIKKFSLVHIHRQKALASGVSRLKAMQIR